MINYDTLKSALILLKEQNDRRNQLSEIVDPWIIEAVKESTIQRFETCWDCLWKVLKRYLEEEVGLANLPNGPKPILRLAHENDLLPSGIESWMKYNQARVDTSHDYSGEKADGALEVINDFVDHAVDLFTTMSGENWT